MAVYTFVGGTSNNIWGATANWSPTGIPGAADNVIFNAVSPGCTVNAPASCLGANFQSGYAGNFTLSSAFLLIGQSGMTLSANMGLTAIGTVATATPVAQSVPNIVIDTSSGGGTCHITSNGTVIPRLQMGYSKGFGAGFTINLGGTCTISQFFTMSYTYGSGLGCKDAMRFNGGTVSIIGGSFSSLVNLTGSSTILLNPPPGAIVNFSGGFANGPNGWSVPLVINAPGATVNIGGYHELRNGGSIYHTAGTVNVASAHDLVIVGNGNTISTPGISWSRFFFGGYPGWFGLNGQLTSLGNFNVDGNVGWLIGIGITFTSPGNRLILSGNKVVPGSGATYTFAGLNTNLVISGTGTRNIATIVNSPATFANGTFEINMSSGTCVFLPVSNSSFYWGNGATFTSSTVNRIDAGNAVFGFAGATGSNINVPGLTVGSAVSAAGSRVNINQPIYFNNLTSNANSYFAGTRGWTATNFTAAGNTTFKAGLTYSVGGVFSMAGSSPAARIGLFSDTRIDFTGSINAGTLTLSAGTALPVGAIISQRSGLIPLGLAQLLPGRPSIVSGGLTSYSISPALTTPVGPTAIAMSAGRPAYFTMLQPGSSAPALLWVTTQDINSSYGNPLFPSESPNDTAGQPNPNLYRTVNWGALAAPGLPLAKTFCS